MTPADVLGPTRRAHLKRRRWPGFVGGAIAIGVLVAIHATFARQLKVPIIYGDELGYIENARYIVHGGQAPARTYYPGISLLLVPIARLTTSALTLWRSAQAINTAAAVITALEAIALGSVWGLSRWARWVVGLAAATYPPVLLYTSTALSESLFTCLFVGLVLLVSIAAAQPERGVRRQNPYAGTGIWAAIGLTSAALCLVHPRGYAVDVAVVITAALVLRPLRWYWSSWTGLIAGLTLGSAFTRIALVGTAATNVGGRSDYEATNVVGRNLNLHAVFGLTSGMVGRLFYLSVATAGLAPFALVTGLMALYAVARGDKRRLQIVRAFLGLSTLGVIGLSVLLVNGGTRADQLIHGRYVDGVVVPLIVVGLGDVVLSRGRRWWVWAASGLVTLGVSGGLLASTGSFTNLTAPINAINILGIEPLVRRLSNDIVDVLPLVLAGAAVIAVLSIIAIRLPVVAAAVLIVAFSLSASDTQSGYLVPGSGARARQTVLVDAIQAASKEVGVPRQCVTYDGDLDIDYFADRLLLGTQPLDYLDVGTKPCGPFVITARPAFEQRFPGSRLVIEEDDVNEDLFVLPGRTQDRLAAAGWLQPVTVPGPLPTLGQAGRIKTAASAGVVVPSGTTAMVSASITNAGMVTPWPAVAGLKQGAYAVRLALRWFAPGQELSDPGGTTTPVAETVVDLPKSLLPGETVQMDVPFSARTSTGAPLPPARYQVRMDIYQELVGSFGGGITVGVVVRPPPPPRGAHR